MSARPGLCGGRRATGVPTAIANREQSRLNTLSVLTYVQSTGMLLTFAFI